MDGSTEERSAPSSAEGTSFEERWFAASLAHEINNPLDSLLCLLYLMETEDTLNDRGRDYLALAQQEAQRISQVLHAAMNELCDRAPRKKTNVPELLRSVLALYRSRLELRGISVDARYCPDGDVRVFPGPLRQLFSNLLLNAADAMPNGGRMSVKVSRVHEWTGWQRHGLRVTFADNGSGIAALDMPRIAEPFFTTKGPAGTGIGLFLVKDTVAKHGGVLRVRSSTTLGRSGSVFSVFLPSA
ncbi:MAG: HAMP domain-containing sensor histidine kinase [Candidatus Korobacteraceae bacterium]